MDMFAKLRENLKTKRRTIVFTEGPDPRILEATFRLKNENLMDVILVGNESEVRTAAATASISPVSPSSTLPLIPRWTPWCPPWWICARAR